MLKKLEDVAETYKELQARRLPRIAFCQSSRTLAKGCERFRPVPMALFRMVCLSPFVTLQPLVRLSR